MIFDIQNIEWKDGEIVGQGKAAPLSRSGERLTDNNNATDGHDEEGGRW